MGKTLNVAKNSGAGTGRAAGANYLIGADDELAVGEALQQVEAVRYDPANKRYIITTIEGQITVTMDPPGAYNPDELDAAAVRAAYISAFSYSASFEPISAPDHVLEMGDLYASVQDMEPGTKAHTAAIDRLVALSQEHLQGDEHLASLDVCNERPEEADRLPTATSSKRLEAKRRAERLGAAMSSMMKKVDLAGTDITPMEALFNGVKNEEDLLVLQDQFAERREAAIALFGEHGEAMIPKSRLNFENEDTGEVDEDGNPITRIVSTGDIHADQHFQDCMELFESQVIQGAKRGIIASGPPSTGKDTFIYEMAAMRRMAVVEKNMGPGSDINDLFGGEGIGPEVVYDDKGEFVGTGFSSKRIPGRLITASDYPVAFLLTEVEGVEEVFVRVNTLVGGEVGDPSKRKASAGSISNDIETTPHEDFLLCFSYNPGFRDIQMPSSLKKRCLDLRFEYMTAEDEAEVVAANVRKIFAFGGDDLPDEIKDVKAADVMPVVNLARSIRDKHHMDPQTWKDMPDMRSAAHMYHDLVRAGKNKHPNPVRMMAKTLESMLPGSLQMTISTMNTELNDTLADHEEALNAIGQLGYQYRDKG